MSVLFLQPALSFLRFPAEATSTSLENAPTSTIAFVFSVVWRELMTLRAGIRSQGRKFYASQLPCAMRVLAVGYASATATESALIPLSALLRQPYRACIVSRIGMALRAVRGELAMLWCLLHVFNMRYRFQVCRIHTGPMFTGVMQVQTIDNGPNKHFIKDTVRPSWAPIHANESIARFIQCALPNATRTVSDGIRPIGIFQWQDWSAHTAGLYHAISRVE